MHIARQDKISLRDFMIGVLLSGTIACSLVIFHVLWKPCRSCAGTAAVPPTLTPHSYTRTTTIRNIVLGYAMPATLESGRGEATQETTPLLRRNKSEDGRDGPRHPSVQGRLMLCAFLVSLSFGITQ